MFLQIRITTILIIKTVTLRTFGGLWSNTSLLFFPHISVWPKPLNPENGEASKAYWRNYVFLRRKTKYGAVTEPIIFRVWI